MPRRLLPFLALALCGCFNDPKPAPTSFKSEPHEHSHEREHMLVADAGRYHALLTAHLSQKDGNELDVFFETVGDPPKPHPVPLAKFTATARTADGKEHALEFEPTPIEERKGDPDGKCSHFVAKAGWMKPEDTLTVTATVPLDGKPTPVEWRGFTPKKYAHHVE